MKAGAHPNRPTKLIPTEEFPRGFHGHKRSQALMGLRLTSAERLRWLEETMATLRRWRGRARH